jgi:hypothetical protein
MAESATNADDEVEDFLKRIYGGSDIETERQKLRDTEHSECEEKDSFHISYGTSKFSAFESLRTPQAESRKDEDERPNNKRRCFFTVFEEAPLVVHWPIPFNATSISFEAGEQRYQLEVQDTDWYNRILERYVDAGYCPRSDSLGDVTSVVGIFQSLPPDLADVLKEGLHALQVVRAARAMPRRPRTDASSTGEGTEQFSATEDAMWEDTDSCGYLRFEWDPATERRR